MRPANSALSAMGALRGDNTLDSTKPATYIIKRKKKKKKEQKELRNLDSFRIIMNMQIRGRTHVLLTSLTAEDPVD